MAYTGKKPVDFVDVTQSQSMTVSDDLTVNNDTTVAGDLTVDTNTLYVDSTNNRVGIGTSSPEASLHIEGSGVSSLRFGNIGPLSNSSIRLSRDDTTVIPGNPLGFLEFGGNDSTSNIDAAFAYVSGEASGTHEAGSNQTDLTFGTTSSGSSTPQERVRIDSGGSLLIAKTTTSTAEAGLDLYNQVGGAGRINIVKTGSGLYSAIANYYNGTYVGGLNYSNTGTAIVTSSDYRLKKDWQPMTGATERVKALNPVNFAWKLDDSRIDGFLAHEVQEVVPEAIFGEKDAMVDEEYEVTPAVLDEDGNVVTEAVMGTRQVPDYQGIDQSKLVPLLTAALQEAIAEIETLKTKVAALENA